MGIALYLLLTVLVQGPLEVSYVGLLDEVNEGLAYLFLLCQGQERYFSDCVAGDLSRECSVQELAALVKRAAVVVDHRLALNHLAVVRLVEEPVADPHAALCDEKCFIDLVELFLNHLVSLVDAWFQVMADLDDELFVARIVTEGLSLNAEDRIVHPEVDLKCVQKVSEQKFEVELSGDALRQLLEDVLLFL